jgi:hypothetical protein
MPPIKKASSEIDSKRFSKDFAEMGKGEKDSSGSPLKPISPGAETWNRSTLFLVALLAVLMLLGFFIWRRHRGRGEK